MQLNSCFYQRIVLSFRQNAPEIGIQTRQKDGRLSAVRLQSTFHFQILSPYLRLHIKYPQAIR